jgi:hypothetical protein
MYRGRAGPDGVMFFEDMARRAVAQVPKPENNITPMWPVLLTTYKKPDITNSRGGCTVMSHHDWTFMPQLYCTLELPIFQAVYGQRMMKSACISGSVCTKTDPQIMVVKVAGYVW